MLSKGFDIWVSIGELLWLNINVTIFVFRMLVGSKVKGTRGTWGSVFPRANEGRLTHVFSPSNAPGFAARDQECMDCVNISRRNLEFSLVHSKKISFTEGYFRNVKLRSCPYKRRPTGTFKEGRLLRIRLFEVSFTTFRVFNLSRSSIVRVRFRSSTTVEMCFFLQLPWKHCALGLKYLSQFASACWSRSNLGT
jgi:hypothetical protein